MSENSQLFSNFQEISFTTIGGWSFNNLSTVKHPKYIYTPEFHPWVYLEAIITQSTSNNSFQNLQYKLIRWDLINIVKTVNLSFCFSSSTLFKAINYCDLFFSQDSSITELSDFLLIGVSSLIISVKYNETSVNIPSLYDFSKKVAEITQNSFDYNIDQLKKAEIFILNKINFNLSNFSVYDFLGFLFTHGIVINTERNSKKGVLVKKLELIYMNSRHILDMVIEETIIFTNMDCFSAAVIILRKAITQAFSSYSVESLLESDVFSLIYNVDLLFDIERYSQLESIIQSNLNVKNTKNNCSSKNSASTASVKSQNISTDNNNCSTRIISDIIHSTWSNRDRKDMIKNACTNTETMLIKDFNTIAGIQFYQIMPIIYPIVNLVNPNIINNNNVNSRFKNNFYFQWNNMYITNQYK